MEARENQKWPIVCLGDVCEVIAGQSPEGEFYNEKGQGTPFYQGKTDFTERYIDEPTNWTTKETKIAEKNDILMSVRAPVGPVNIATQRVCIGRGLAAIRSTDKVLMPYVFNLGRFKFLTQHFDNTLFPVSSILKFFLDVHSVVFLHTGVLSNLPC